MVNSADTGGAQTLIEALAARHRAFGVQSDVVVLLGRDSLSDRLERAANNVYYLNIRKSPFAIFSALLRFKRILAATKPNIIHSHLLQSDLLVALSGGAAVHLSTVHTSGGHESGLGSRVVTALVARLAKRIDSLVACSPSAATFIEQRYGRSPDQIVLNGTILGASLVAAPRSDEQVLCLSRWHPMKDHRTLLAAMSRLGEEAPLLVCAGAGMTHENRELMELINEFQNVRIELRGPINNVRETLEQSRALIISSSHGEALPMAGIEALAAGVPVVTTDVGDCRLLAVSPELLVSPRDPQGLASSIHAALSSDRDWSAAAHSLAVREFDIQRSAERYHDLYCTLSESDRLT